MFLTMPLTTAPSCSVARSASRSAPWLASSTARRETTTLLRLRSSLMTLNSICLFSYGVVSFTGRISTSDPGRNALMPFTVTVRPPLTLPLMTPETTVPFSSASSRSSQRRETLRLLAREPRLAVAVLEGLDRHLHEVAGLDLDPRRGRCGTRRARM
jgi:hypothetical protein